MTEPELVQRERALLRDLSKLIRDRAQGETAAEAAYVQSAAGANQQFRAAKQMLQRFKQERENAEKEFRESRQRLSQQFRTEYKQTKHEFASVREDISERYKFEKQTAKEEYRETRWTTKTVCEAAKGAAVDQRNEMTLEVAAAQHELQTLQQRASEHLRACRQGGVIDSVSVARRQVKPQDDAIALVQECKLTADEQFEELRALPLPGMFRGLRPAWFVFSLLIIAVLGGILLFNLPINPLEWGEHWMTIVSLAGAGVAVAGVILLGLYFSARSQLAGAYQPLRQAVSDGEALKRRCEAQAQLVYEKEVAKCEKKRDGELSQARAKYTKRRAQLKTQALEEFRQARDKFVPLLRRLQEKVTADLKAAGERVRQRRQAARDGYRVERQRMVDHYSRSRTEAKERIQRERRELHERWQQGVAHARGSISTINRACSERFPDWIEPTWNQWHTPQTVAHALRFGEFRVPFERFHREAANKDWLKIEEAFTLPALVPFPHNGSLLLKVNDAGRASAVQALQNIMMRYLTCLPPGKVRFTIIDPVGLGENFAAFMHLADHDEQLVASRIWTEQAHIEQRLADLTAHMENVIQKYLRNQFETIEDYNVHAGEVAEPYRVLVIANFPANFSNEAARRLLSIASTGARCGVYTLISVDMKQRLPEGTDFHLADLESSALTLEWDGQRFRWRDEEFGAFPLLLDSPPSNDFCTRVLQVVGAQAKEAKRVEVPFEFIVPPVERWWTGDTRPGLAVPLGRAGATKRQHLRLGHGTAQHVLIAGKTGSGKSTLLHALITNASLIYSPDELELYLVDFKKGVEFKTYATHELPHARIVAIESEREFGLSVLQRLDAELKARADRFRELGAQELAAYRNSNGNKPCPRILLIVDEFQEFFTEDDKIAQEAALLLDRLVRQGRAFGIHVLLGSQTLGGAYTLARSTIDQMAVRIALQCSEADGHIILSEDNAAARLLSRPGEAIYNDANGLVEGNDPFQIVWLADEKREDYLDQIHDLAEHKLTRRLPPQIVFEGNAPADVRKNDFLQRAIVTVGEPQPLQRAGLAWLGEAIAIKDPTCAIFRRQSGSNLMVIGQQEDAALGMFATALVSLAAQQPPAEALDRGAGCRFFVLDGMAEDALHAGLFQRLAEVLPHPVQIGGWRDAAGMVATLSAELDRRQQAHDTHAPALFVVVQGLQRFRDLRRSEEDFGFSKPDEPANPAKQFANLLKEGPGFGIHLLVWCDTLNNLHRTLERHALRDFELRVLFQMGSADSSNLIDSPLASKLGMHRAIFFAEEQGKLEKFRPYGIPTAEWLAWVSERLRERQPVEGGMAVGASG
jgi:ABC-type multidrug transport system fused ATPase/permease subunit